MTVALPTGGIAHAEPRFIDRGSVLKAALGGDDQRLDRLGSKFGCTFTVKPMKADEARLWIARLIRGRKEKASIKFPQPGYPLAVTRDFVVDGPHAANAEVLNLSVAFADQIGKTFGEGQFISIVSDGKRYLHQLTTNGTVDGALKAIVGIQPPLRKSLLSGIPVEVLTPKIEGYVTGDDTRWSIDNAKIYGLQFDIEEAA